MVFLPAAASAASVFSVEALCCDAPAVKLNEIQIVVDRSVFSGNPDINSITKMLTEASSPDCAAQLVTNTAYPTSTSTIITARFKDAACTRQLHQAVMSHLRQLVLDGRSPVPLGSFIRVRTTGTESSVGCKGALGIAVHVL